jgi:hypothetical protein
MRDSLFLRGGTNVSGFEGFHVVPIRPSGRGGFERKQSFRKLNWT